MSLFDSTHTVCTDCFNSEEHIFQKHTLWQLFKEGQKLCRKWLGENTVGTLRTHCHIWMLCCWVVLLKKTKSSFLIIKVIRNVCLSFISFWMQNVCLFFFTLSSSICVRMLQPCSKLHRQRQLLPGGVTGSSPLSDTTPILLFYLASQPIMKYQKQNM